MRSRHDASELRKNSSAPSLVRAVQEGRPVIASCSRQIIVSVVDATRNYVRVQLSFGIIMPEC